MEEAPCWAGAKAAAPATIEAMMADLNMVSFIAIVLVREAERYVYRKAERTKEREAMLVPTRPTRADDLSLAALFKLTATCSTDGSLAKNTENRNRKPF